MKRQLVANLYHHTVVERLTFFAFSFTVYPCIRDGVVLSSHWPVRVRRYCLPCCAADQRPWWQIRQLVDLSALSRLEIGRYLTFTESNYLSCLDCIVCGLVALTWVVWFWAICGLCGLGSTGSGRGKGD